VGKMTVFLVAVR